MSGSAAGAHGGIDLENITTGTNATAREKQKHLSDDLRKLVQSECVGWLVPYFG